MKRSMWKIFAFLAIVMTFGFAQTSWAGDRICQDDVDDPLGIVTGVIAIPDDSAYTDRDCWAIEETDLVICGVPDYLGLEEGNTVTFEYDTRPCNESVACSVDDGTMYTILRPQKNKDAESDTVVTVVSGICDCDCDKECTCTSGDLDVCECKMYCNCYCEE